MAGIGFVLECVIDRNGLRGLAGAAAAGVLIVAGPWLISSIALFVVSTAIADGAPRFFGLVVYTYASSLLLFGGYHYRFTRILADALYNRDYQLVAGTYRRALVVAGLGSLPLGVLIAMLGRWSDVRILVPVVLYLAINTGWIHTLFSSLLRDFRIILWSYVLGALPVAVTVMLVGPARIDVDGAAMLFAGALLLTGVLQWLGVRHSLERSTARGRRRELGRAGSAPGKATLQRLMVIGWGLAAVLWLDKMLYWWLLGAPVEGSLLWLYPVYDQTVFIAQLFVIPPTVVFVIRVETAYFRGLRAVMQQLRRGTRIDLLRARSALETRYYDALRGQMLTQLLMLVLLALAAPELVRLAGTGSVRLLIVSGAAAQLYLLFYTLIVNLLYLADYRAAVTVIVTTVLCTLLSTLALYFAFGEASVGYAFLLSAALGSAGAGYVQKRGLHDFDWLVLTRINA